MQKYADSAAVSVNSGPILPVGGALVQVNNSGTRIPATIYSDNGVTQTANPLVTNANGGYAFYAADGRYDLLISGVGFPAVVINDILLVDILPSDIPAAPPSSRGILWNNGGAISVSADASLLDGSWLLDGSRLLDGLYF